MVSKDEIEKGLEEKRKGINSPKEGKKKVNIFNQLKDWWDKRTKDEKIITGAITFIGVILIVTVGIMLIAIIMTPETTHLQIEGAQFDSVGAYYVNIDNATTVYTITGSSEAGANVTVNSTDLNITTQQLNLNSTNGFQYNVTIPANVSAVRVMFNANKTGKSSSSLELTIKRPSPVATPVPSTTTPPTTSTTLEYQVADSIFQMPEGWRKVDKYTGNIVGFVIGETEGITLKVRQYTDANEQNSEYNEYSQSGSGFTVTTSKKTISGIQTKVVKTVYNDMTMEDYYFQKNGKYYRITTEDMRTSKDHNVIDTALNTVISTLR